MHGHCGSFILKKAFISLNTGDQTSLNVPTLSNSPRDLKNLLSLKTKKFWVFLYPRTIFFPEAQAEKADKRSWFDWAVPSLAFFFFPQLSLCLSLSLFLSLTLCSQYGNLPSSLGGGPACASLSECLSPKDVLCGSINTFENRKMWYGTEILAPTASTSAKSPYRFHGILPFIIITNMFPEQ